MFSKMGLRHLLIAVFITFIDARLISLTNVDKSRVGIESVSTMNLPITKVSVSKNRASQLPLASRNMHKSVCYPVVGCFNNSQPFDNAGLEVPQSPDHIGTQFLLYTQEVPTTPDLLFYDGNDQSILTSHLNTSRWLRIIVHGFSNNRNSIWIKPLQDELLKLKDNELSDVLVVDWGNGAKFPYYTNAASNIRLVGKQIGLLLQKLHDLRGSSFDKIHCIGHSLGAHTCASASNAINNRMARISGLDPAGPFFEGKHEAVRLDQNDAKFVDVIHSNTEIALGVGLGSSQPSGHIDFYVNGGKQQPGCPSMTTLFDDLITGHSAAAFEETSCSHTRSHGYFTESINSECPFNAFPCNDYDSLINGKCPGCSASGCSRMGFSSIYSPGRGIMYLTTKDTSPFCGHHYLIELELDRNMDTTKGEIFISIHSNYETLSNVSMTLQSKVEFKAGDILQHVFSYRTDIGKFDYAIVYFRRETILFGLGGGKGHSIAVSNLRLKSLEDASVYSGPCGDRKKVATDTSETFLLDPVDCHRQN